MFCQCNFFIKSARWKSVIIFQRFSSKENKLVWNLTFHADTAVILAEDCCSAVWKWKASIKSRDKEKLTSNFDYFANLFAFMKFPRKQSKGRKIEIGWESRLFTNFPLCTSRSNYTRYRNVKKCRIYLFRFLDYQRKLWSINKLKERLKIMVHYWLYIYIDYIYLFLFSLLLLLLFLLLSLLLLLLVFIVLLRFLLWLL